MKNSLIMTILMFSTINTMAAATKGGSDIGSGTDTKISCIAGVLTASAEPGEGSVLTAKNYLVELKKIKDGEYEGGLKVTSKTGQKGELHMTALEYPENKVTAIDVSLSIDDKSVIFDSVLMKSDGLSVGYGWDLGPEKAEQLRMLYSNTMRSKTFDANITQAASVILTKYGYSVRKEENGTNELYDAAAKAVKEGKLKEGEIIGTFNSMGCFKQ